MNAVDTREIKRRSSTEKEIEKKVLTAMLRSLYKNKFLNSTVYNKVRADIKKL